MGGTAQDRLRWVETIIEVSIQGIGQLPGLIQALP